MRFDYSVIRFVPDTTRGEYLNLGVIVTGGNRWSLRRVEIQDRRAKALHAGKTLLPAANEAVDHIEHRLSAAGGPPAEWLNTLMDRHRSIVQFSPPAPLNAGSIEDAEAILAGLFLTEAEHRSRGG